jgi:hypothetical protein
VADLRFALADSARLDVFAALAQSRRALRFGTQFVDSGDVVWQFAQIGVTAVGFTPLGPGWVWDADARRDRHEDYEQLLAEYRALSMADRRRAVLKVFSNLRLGGHFERICWAIHLAVLAQRSSLLRLPDASLARAVWGLNKRPRHWRGVLLALLRSLTWLHIADRPDQAKNPDFGAQSVLLTHAGDLRGDDQDSCPETCPMYATGRHHHFQIEIGPGFLGILESLSRLTDTPGIREYHFPMDVHKGSDAASLRRLGRTGRLQSLFVPAKLGAPSKCRRLSPVQHRILQAVVRETTRAKRESRSDASKSEVFAGNQILAFHGKHRIECPLLDPSSEHVAFAGNGKRKGLGYLLTSSEGWLGKCGYTNSEIPTFLADLAALEKLLGLIAVGVDRSGQIVGISELQRLAVSRVGTRSLALFHVRIYATADYVARWSKYFGFDDDAITALVADMRTKGVTVQALANGMGIDASFLAKVISGKRPWPTQRLRKAKLYVASIDKTKVCRPSKKEPTEPNLAVALDYLRTGWSVVPQLAGAKQPCIKWKKYQLTLPTRSELIAWFREWPDAGLAVVLGPVSNLYVIDVDGVDAHAALMNQLGRKSPRAPKALSGSRAPGRYHLFFRCPDFPTRAKQTPWHKQLEFRGQGGIVIIPPSLHKSGNRYAWAEGRSPDDLELPDLPQVVLRALKPIPKAKPPSQSSAQFRKSVASVDAAQSTLAFLSGQYQNGPNWNAKLFRAACDLKGRGMPITEAQVLLLRGAGPWTRGDEDLALRTIASAYSRAREPGRI